MTKPITLPTKLSLMLAAGIALCALALSLSFLWLIKSHLQRHSVEKAEILMEGAAKIAHESLVVNDPLMLLSYVSFLKNEHPEIWSARIMRNERWYDIKKAARGKPPRKMLFRKKDIRVSGGKRAVVEMVFDWEILNLEFSRLFARTVRDAVAISVVVCALSCLVMLLASRRITRRLWTLEETIDAITHGELGVQAKVFSDDEVGRLASRFNEMSLKLEEIDQMKKDFFSSVTHEFRSPLAAIESTTKVLQKSASGIGRAERDYLAAIQKNVSRLDKFISRILRAANIEKGEVRVWPRPAPLGPIIRDTVLFLSPRAKEVNIELSCEASPDLPEALIDPDRIQEVFINLITNAIKFTRAGGRVAVCARKKGDGDPGQIECMVQDTGIGIPKKDQARIFRPFERVKDPMKAQGTGLGLFISRFIVEQHGGKISLESAPGEGSTFSFTVPAA